MNRELTAEEKEQLTSQTIDNYEEYINPAMAKLFRFMGLGTVEWKAEGCYIKDINGQEFLDCLGGYGVFSLGHSHPRVVEAVKNQLEAMPLGSKVLFNQPAGELAALLAKITPGELKYSFFCNSGAEAVEGALKLARLHTGRQAVIAANNGFHGKTLGALSATGRDVFRDPCKPLLPDFMHVPFGNIDAIKEIITDKVAAVILEPIQGEGGIILPSETYLKEVRQLCDKYGALLILDEVQTGLGRTGKMFASEHYNVVPDIMTLAKALGGGVMPIGAFIAKADIWNVFVESPFMHTSTFGGSPLACAAAVEAIKVTLEEKVANQAKEKGEYFLDKLNKLRIDYPEVVTDVRGKGLLIGLDLAKEGLGGMLMSELIQERVIAAYTLNNPKVIRIEPPLIISYQDIDRVINVLEKALQAAKDVVEDM